jgi:hypothetical protein
MAVLAENSGGSRKSRSWRFYPRGPSKKRPGWSTSAPERSTDGKEEPGSVVVFDDVLSGGSHFKAVKMVLRSAFPDIPVSGMFLARSIHPPDLTFEDMIAASLS